MNSETVRFDEGNEPRGGLLTVPDGVDSPPVVLIVPAIGGLNDYTVGVTQQFAERGFATLAIDHYVREGRPPDLSSMEKILTAVANLPDQRVIEDVRAGREYLRTADGLDGDRVSALGFCIGGALAMMSAATVPDFQSIVTFYGQLRHRGQMAEKPVPPIETVEDLNCPMLGHFGDRDHVIPMEDVAELRTKLADKTAEVYVYPGAPHAFHEHHRPNFRPVAAQTAWRRTLIHLNWYLRGVIGNGNG